MNPTHCLGLGLLVALPLSLVGCGWHLEPGPVPFELAAAPVPLLSVPGPGTDTIVRIAVRAGSAYDPPGREGLAYLTAQLLRHGGAGERTGDDVDALLGDLEVEVGRELVAFQIELTPETDPVVLEVLGDMLTAPVLDAEVFESLRAEALSRATEVGTQPGPGLAREIFDGLIFSGHPYGHPPQGRSGVLPTLGLEEIRHFLAKRYLRSVVALGASTGPEGAEPSGSADLMASLTALRDRLSTLPAALHRDVTPRGMVPVEGRQVLVVERAEPGMDIILGHPTALTPAHPDWVPMLAAFAAFESAEPGESPALGSPPMAWRVAPGLDGTPGSGGRIQYALALHAHQPALLRKRAAPGPAAEPVPVSDDQGAQSGPGPGDQPGEPPVAGPVAPSPLAEEPTSPSGVADLDEGGAAASVADPGTVEPSGAAQRTQDLLSGVFTRLEGLASGGIDTDTLASVQAQLGARLTQRQADPQAHLQWVLEAALLGVASPESLTEQLAALSVDEVNAAIGRHLDPENLQVVMLTAESPGLESLGVEESADTDVYGDQATPDPEHEAPDAGGDLHLARVRVIPVDDIFR